MKQKQVSFGRCFACLLAVTVILSSFSAFGVSAGTIGGFTFENVEGGVRIVSADVDTPNIVIPASLGGKPVVEIGRMVFSTKPYQEKLESVTLPEGLLVIGEGAFQYCEALKNVNIPSTVKTIERNAFQSCPIEFVSLPEGLVSVGMAAFRWTSIRELYIPKSLTSLDAMAFSGCDELRYITVAEDHPLYTASGNCLIDKEGTIVLGCSASVIPTDGSAVAIGDHAFRYLDFETFVIPSAIKSIGYCAFSQCHIQRLELNDGLEKIGVEAFSDCFDIEIVDLPATVTEIGNEAFLMCEHLKSVTLPSGLKIMGERAFAHCDALENVEIPNGVETLGWYAFSECEKLKSVSIPASVTTVEGGVFSGCVSLTKISCGASSKPEGWNDDWLSGCEAEVEWSKENTKLGDINSDGRINVADYTLLKRAVLKTYTLSEEQKSSADVNGDGRINVADYTLLKRFVMGTIEKLG